MVLVLVLVLVLVSPSSSVASDAASSSDSSVVGSSSAARSSQPTSWRLRKAVDSAALPAASWTCSQALHSPWCAGPAASGPTPPLASSFDGRGVVAALGLGATVLGVTVCSATALGAIVLVDDRVVALVLDDRR